MKIAATTATPVAHAQAIIIVIKVEFFPVVDTGDEVFCDAVLVIALDGLIALGVTVLLLIVLGVTVFVPIVVEVLVTELLGVR